MQDRKFFTSMAAALFFMAGITTSCVNDDVLNQDSFDGRTPINFTSSVASRTTNQTIQDEQIATSNGVGLFITNVTSETEQATTSSSLPTNVKLTADGSGTLTPADNQPIYFPEGASSVDIYAYAPYIDGLSALSTGVTFSVKDDQSTDANYVASDFIIAKKLGVASTESTVNLAFDHKMVKLNLNFDASLSDQLQGATVTVSGVKTEATVNISTGAVTATETAVDITAAKFDETNPELTASVIFVPQTVQSGQLKVTVTKDTDTKYEAVLNQNIEFKGGVRYTYNVEIQNGKLVLNPTTSINGWDDTVISPYNVGDYVLADGTIVSKDNYTTQSDNTVKAIIFSTQVSETDAQNGYAAYAMWLTPVNNKMWSSTEDLLSGVSISDFQSALKDFDGLKKTNDIIASNLYQGIINNSNPTWAGNYKSANDYMFAILNGNDYKSPFSGKSTASQFSGLFAPSIGQMIQILNNLGGANINSTSVSDDSSTSNPIYSVGDLNVINNINTRVTTAVGNAILNTSSSTIYITSTEDDKRFWSLQIRTDGWGFGKNTGKITSPRNMIPCIAIKLPTSASETTAGN